MSEPIEKSKLLLNLTICLDSFFKITDIGTNAGQWFGVNSELLINSPAESLLGLSIKDFSRHVHINKKRITLTKKHTGKNEIQAFISIACLVNSYVITLIPINVENKIMKLSLSSNTEVNDKDMYFEWNYQTSAVYFSKPFLSLLNQDEFDPINSMAYLESCLSAHDTNMFNRTIEESIEKLMPSFSLNCAFKSQGNEAIWVQIAGQITYEPGNVARVITCKVKDVVKNKALLSELKKQNNYLSLAESLSNSGHWRYDVLTGEYYWSKKLYHILSQDSDKYTPVLNLVESQKGKSDFDRCLSMDIVLDCIEKKKPYYNKSFYKQSSGKCVHIETVGEVEIGTSGDVVALFGICRDISKEEGVFEKLKLLAMVNYTIKVPIFFINDNDKVVYQDLSPQTGSLNNLLFDYINFTIEDYLQFKKLAQKHGQIKKQNVSFDKYCSVFNMSITYERDEGIYIWIVEDVTDRFRQEQQQVISNRLALLGNTFGGVSHDINNVLGVALGSIEMLEIKSAQGVKNISPYIERVKNAIDKGKSVTERLLAFTKKPTLKIVEFDPIQELVDNKYLFSQVIFNTIDIDFCLNVPPCSIFFPQGEFINILLNLVINSQDAIQEQKLSGKIIISANIESPSKLQIHVKDSGIGIKDDALSKIFDPFYSSKSLHKGNGIGLANVYNTMYKHNGEITVVGQCELGGAHFCLEFPCSFHRINHPALPHAVNELNLTRKKVLILDDEASIAEFVGLFLEGTGAETIMVNTKYELEAVLEKNNDFDLFITDMILPDLTGRQAAKLVISKVPNIQIFAMSGYLDLKDEKWDYPVLRKPFNSSELTEFLLESIN